MVSAFFSNSGLIFAGALVVYMLASSLGLRPVPSSGVSFIRLIAESSAFLRRSAGQSSNAFSICLNPVGIVASMNCPFSFSVSKLNHARHSPSCRHFWRSSIGNRLILDSNSRNASERCPPVNFEKSSVLANSSTFSAVIWRARHQITAHRHRPYCQKSQYRCQHNFGFPAHIIYLYQFRLAYAIKKTNCRFAGHS